jgi:hypothetical protein
VRNISEEETLWLKEKVGVDVNFLDPVLQAAGVTEDWPVGRGVFIQDAKDFIVLVNFEDHLRMIVVPSSGDEVSKKMNIIDGLTVLVKAIHTFE